jgi:hypothetical protein
MVSIVEQMGSLTVHILDATKQTSVGTSYLSTGKRNTMTTHIDAGYGEPPMQRLPVARFNSDFSDKTWIYNGEKAHTCIAEMIYCEFWFVDPDMLDEIY